MEEKVIYAGADRPGLGDGARNCLGASVPETSGPGRPEPDILRSMLPPLDGERGSAPAPQGMGDGEFLIRLAAALDLISHKIKIRDYLASADSRDRIHLMLKLSQCANAARHTFFSVEEP